MTMLKQTNIALEGGGGGGQNLFSLKDDLNFLLKFKYEIYVAQTGHERFDTSY